MMKSGWYDRELLQMKYVLTHRATSCLLVFPLAAGAIMAAVGRVFLMEVRRMCEVLCM